MPSIMSKSIDGDENKGLLNEAMMRAFSLLAMTIESQARAVARALSAPVNRHTEEEDGGHHSTRASRYHYLPIGARRGPRKLRSSVYFHNVAIWDAIWQASDEARN